MSDHLAPSAFSPLPLGAILPAGWLAQQLRIQADGMSGHLDEFWPSISESKWLGGSGDSWERVPYWLDGFVPLAYLAGDAKLIARAERYVGYIVEHQADDGWLGPNDAGGHDVVDYWPQFLVLKVLAQYVEATGDERALEAMTRCARALDARFDNHPPRDWALYRCPDLLWGLQWLLDRTGNAWLVPLMRRASRTCYDWLSHFAAFPYTAKAAPRAAGNRGSSWRFDNHVVNHAMAVKAPAVAHRLGDLHDALAAAECVVAELDRHHGQATGVFTGDESLAGLMPSQGTELCAVVEYLFSLEVLMATFAHAPFGDRLERIAFNALPATFGPDMWTHQYDQQANQVSCSRIDEPIFTNNGGDANLFGLEPNFGCCTANMHQGWPKFVSHLWMKSADGGLVAAAYAPCRVTTDALGGAVTIDVTTEYPFDDTIHIAMTLERTGRFPLRLRIPAWTENTTVEVDGAPVVGRIKGRRLPNWGLDRGAAQAPPQSPVRSDEPLQDLELIPYGCTDLRVTELPVLDEDATA